MPSLMRIVGEVVESSVAHRVAPSIRVKVRENDKKKFCRVYHFDNYGVLVEGTSDYAVGISALIKAGYDADDACDWARRATRVEQTWSADGHAVGGESAVAFYFQTSP